MLELVSDRIRLAHLKAPDERVDTNDLRPARTDVLTRDNDFVYVRETPNYLVYTERWLPVCRAALHKKYGASTNAVIMAKMPPRFARVGEEIGLRMKHHEIVAGKSVVIYAKSKAAVSTRERAITRKDAEPILKTLRASGFKPELIGSIARVGHSSHDIDIVVPFIAEGVVDDPMEFPEYARYHEVMKGLGFKFVWEGKLYEEGRKYDEVELETWQKDDLIVDIYPRALEPGIDVSATRTKKRSRKREPKKAPTSLRGLNG